ncbi:hypothetical protein LWI28_001871 [Acer negundo]|uniref:Serine-threonine/tyrosine-protein kinase catalytic domain-containing protein n=1 Tax=Acer negundo TaxID=4023 RepID=A0AAD5ICI7_ACENE|nr:hypothetical protein LWI28_001871 [Acer negundo]
MLSLSSIQGDKQFQTEVELLLRVHHKNLTTLVGYCDDGTNMGLIYEFMPNGNLESHLLDEGSSTADILSWGGRLRIATETAQGLEYLHSGYQKDIALPNVEDKGQVAGQKSNKEGNGGEDRKRKMVSGCFSKLILCSVAGVLSKRDKNKDSYHHSMKTKPTNGFSCNAKLSLKESLGIDADEGRKVESWSSSKEMDCTDGQLFYFQILKGGNVNRINEVGPEFCINNPKVVKKGPNSKVGFGFVGPDYKAKVDSQLGLEPLNCNGLGDGLVNYQAEVDNFKEGQFQSPMEGGCPDEVSMELPIASNLVIVPVMWDGSIMNFRLAVKGHGMKTRSFKNNFKISWILEE